MSADNGIYIAKFPDGYRVTLAQAIDNIDYFPKGSEERKKELRKYFGKSSLFQTEEKAMVFAQKLLEEIPSNSEYYDILEYGICTLGEYESFLPETESLPNKEQEQIKKAISHLRNAANALFGGDFGSTEAAIKIADNILSYMLYNDYLYKDYSKE